MWISRAVWERCLAEIGELQDWCANERDRHAILSEQATQYVEKLREQYGQERGQREVLASQVAVQKSFIEFLCSRVNQLEAERVLLLRHLTSIDLPAPTLRPTQPEAPSVDPLSALSSMSIFDDDPRHAPRGWHADGSVNYADDPVTP